MTGTSLYLSGRLDPLRERVFRDVAAAAAALGIPFFIVGACARDLLLDLYHGLPAQRATNDIDFGIRVETWGREMGEERLGNGILLGEAGQLRGRCRIAPIAAGNVQVHWPEGNKLVRRGVCDPECGIPDYNALVEIERMR